MADIRIQRVRKVFNNTVVAVNDVDLHIQDQEFLVLLGPSGCGKTTLLRCIAGLEDVTSGRIFIGERDVTYLPPRQRRIAMVFQSYAVFPHMTVFENIAFGLRMQKAPQHVVDERVHEAARLMHIEELLERYPAQLSGGQRQRVAVARAIAVQSDVLLMDEPLSNLDALLRLEMRAELKRLFNRLQTTVVYVTHDQVEAMSMGDRIAVMNAGRLIQLDKPTRVYDYPATKFVGGFIGNPPMNFLRVYLTDDQRAASIGDVQIPIPDEVRRALRGDRVEIGIRAENIEVATEPKEHWLPAEVAVVEPLGSHNLLTVECGGHLLKVNVPADLSLSPGMTIWLRFVPEKVRWFDSESGQALLSPPPETA
ncbi:MAG: ABC transporter ATP-binding protein [Ardenticatenia bacterium]|nr:MAG: ABC transporter ATP-binding protein [Ardenticatenia bacterium]